LEKRGYITRFSLEKRVIQEIER